MPGETILFAMFNESGHVTPSFKLARGLRGHGFDVRYLAGEDLRPSIEAQGFAVEALGPPPSRAALGGDSRLAALRARRELTRSFEAEIERLSARSPYDERRCRPALMLVDVTMTHVALWARRARVPFAYVSTSLPQTRDPGVPPSRTALPFGRDLKSLARVELAWAEFLLRRRATARAARIGGMCPSYDIARRAAARFGVAEAELDVETVFMPQLRGVPELVLCHRDFDFPRPVRPDRHPVESIDLERREQAFDWSPIPADRPLIYCALGGQLYRAEEARAFFRRVVDAARGRDLHLLLSLGRYMSVEELGPVPTNVTAAQYVPQLAVLRRARVMITHAGLGSVKEAIAHGVPMLAVPLDVDQPGNAARVVHHGLGLAVDVAKASAAELREMIERLVHGAGFRERTANMQARFRELEASAPGANIVAKLVEATASRLSA